LGGGTRPKNKIFKKKLEFTNLSSDPDHNTLTQLGCGWYHCKLLACPVILSHNTLCHVIRWETKFQKKIQKFDL
jgi:hypothetical protein